MSKHKAPSGQPISYPECGDWTCDDYDYDWAVATNDDPEYAGAKREQQIVRYHQPREDWPRRLREERDKRNGGRPLWSGVHR